MKRRVEGVISDRTRGMSARDLLSMLEADTPDTRIVRAQLLKDLHSVGVDLDPSEVTAEGTCIKVQVSRALSEDTRSVLLGVCDTYSRTYPEIELLSAVFRRKL